MIKGITVQLHVKTQTETDGFDMPIYEETVVSVENVLVAPSTSNDETDNTNLDGKVAIYDLAIPKGDTHEWEATIVEFFGQKWHTIGFVTEGIEDLIPLSWNKKVSVERHV